MTFKREISTVLLGICSFWVFAQDPSDMIQEIVEDIAERSLQEIDYAELTDHLRYIQKHPLDINSASLDELEGLMFLNHNQRTAIVEYRVKYGSFLNILELQSLQVFDVETIRLARIFLVVKTENPFQTVFPQDSEVSLLFRVGREFEKFASPESHKGTPIRLMTRLNIILNSNYSASLNAEKDAGEKFRINPFQGFDFWSGNIYYKGHGVLRKVVLGDYSLQFGQGLGLWSGLSFGKGGASISLAKPEVGLKPYSSTNEASFFRGFAATMALGKSSITPFISLRKIDANLSEYGTITSISESGLHRTTYELENKGAASQLVAGLNLQFYLRNLKLGGTAYLTRFSAEYEPDNILYRRYDFTGKELQNSSLYYKYNYKGTYLFGEGAHSSGSGFGFIAGFIRALSHNISVLLLYRKYDKDYHSFFANPVSESSRSGNEEGFYTGLDFRLSSKWNLSTYFDSFKFPWLKYRIDAPSSGYESFVQLTYSQSKDFRISGRYKMQVKEENSEAHTTVSFLDPVYKQNFRLEAFHKLNRNISIRQRNEMVFYSKGSTGSELGLLSYLDLLYHPTQSPFSGNLRIAYCAIPGFNTRIYSYQNDVLFAYSVPAYQGSGMSFYFNTNLSITNRIDLWVKYSISRLNPNQSKETSSEKIVRQDVKVQFRIRFQR